MRIVFVGAIEFSRHCLEAVLREAGHVVGIFTLPPHVGKSRHSDYVGKSRHSDYADLAPLAVENAIPFHLVRDLNDHPDLIRKYEPDVLFCFGWSGLLSKEILNIPTVGCLGSHPALLPQNRGRHPIIWTIALGLREAGLTFFWLREGADNGPILAQRAFSISDMWNSGTVYEAVCGVAEWMIPKFLPQLRSGSFPTIPQDHSLTNVWRKRTYEDGRIDFHMSTIAIDRLVRALARPYCGAHVRYGVRDVKIWQTEPANYFVGLDNHEPGKVLDIDPGENRRKRYVKTGDGVIGLVEHGFLAEYGKLPEPGTYID